LKQAVRSGNSGHLTKISGLGKKNAEKIVLELSDKLGVTDNTGLNIKDEGDAIEALASLGYSQKEARDALRNVPSDVVGTSDRVKRALKTLGNK
jgi:Holliday junction DNA helicase RuvA